MNFKMIFAAFLALLSILGTTKCIEVLEIDFSVEKDNDQLVSISTNIVDGTCIPTLVQATYLSSMSVLPPITVAPVTVPVPSQISFQAPTITLSGAACQIAQKKTEIISYVNSYISNATIKETTQVINIPQEIITTASVAKKISSVLEKKTEIISYVNSYISSATIKETTQVINIPQEIITTASVAKKISSVLDSDINEIWQQLESNFIEKKKEKKQAACSVKSKIKEEDPTKLFHTLPAKKNKNGCMIEQTVIIPQIPLSISSLPPPATSIISNISDKIESAKELVSSKVEKLVYNCITNYAGTATTTVTQLSVIPVPTTSYNVSTSTIFAPTTQKIFEVLYTPYTVTKTTTDTMYMIKVTTACKAGCNACELDVNGMVLPAGQLPPGIFATPVNEVDRNLYDIVGYAGMNPSSFKAEIQGFLSTATV